MGWPDGCPSPSSNSNNNNKGNGISATARIEIGVVVFVIVLLALVAIATIGFFVVREVRRKIAAEHTQLRGIALADPLLSNAGSASARSSVNGHGDASVAATASSRVPPASASISQKKKARADTSHLASARIDPADLSPFLDNTTDDPILLGRGGFGAVFLANLRGHDDVVAVKMMRDLANPRAVAMFRKEYRLHLRLSMRCEGVCRMFGICENHALFKTCFVMKRYKCSLLDEIRAVPGGGGITMERLLDTRRDARAHDGDRCTSRTTSSSRT